MTMIEVVNLQVRLGRGRHVLKGIDLVIEKGRLTFLIGSNGAGKTTLLKTIAGLIEPEGGQILLQGRPCAELSVAERAKLIAYMPQGGRVAWPLSVKDIVALGRMPHGEQIVSLTCEGEKAVAEAIASVDLAGFENRLVTELSGGERARVLLARALSTRAPILLTDEPVAALDPRHQLIVLEVLREMARQGAAVVVVMHDLALAARFADQIVLLDDGRVASYGAPDFVLTTENLARSFGVASTIVQNGNHLKVTIEHPLMIDEYRNSS